MTQIKERVIYVKGKPLRGTIIDLETIGPIREEYKGSKRYDEVKPYLFGFLMENTLIQKYVEKPDHIPDLVQVIKELKFSDTFKHPLYAFFTEFETGVIYCATGKKIIFDGDLKIGTGSKETTVIEFGINQYEDPFPGVGFRCIQEFKKGNIDDCLKHNEACILKERDILFKRGFTVPKEVSIQNPEGWKENVH